MTRLPRLKPSALSPEQRAVYQAITSGPRSAGRQMFPLRDEEGSLEGPFNLMLYCPPAGLALQELGAALRYSTTLPPRIRELAILTVAAALQCDFEWVAHIGIAHAAGVPPELSGSLRDGRQPDFADHTDETVVNVVKTVLDGRRLADAEYTGAVTAVGVRGMVELVLLVGYYTTLAKAMAVFEVHLPAGQPLIWG